MKTKIYKFLVLLILPVIYYVIVSGFHRTGGTTNEITSLAMTVNVPKDFMNFILNVDYQYGNSTTNCGSHPWQMENHISEYVDLNFNGVALYDADSGSYCLGNFNSDLLTGQINKTNSLIDSAHQNGLKAIYERSNISNLCYAQRLVYEIANGGSTTVNDGFCYRLCRGKYEVEPDGTTAIHACVNPAECNIENWDGMPQNICETIYENLQHTDLPNFRPQLRDVWDWHLKPRMKIRQQDFNINDTRPVVSIIPVRFDGTEMDTITIRVNNFRNDSGAYFGEYKENFTFLGPLDSLWVPGNETDGLNKGRTDVWWEWDDENVNNPNKCKVDFKIHWEGNVDVWFDKLTVDDYRANKLFDPDPLKNYEPYLNAELTNFSGSGKMDIFFVDETVYSNIPCIKYVTDYIRQHSPGTYISCAVTKVLNVVSLKNDEIGFRPFLEAVQPDYFQCDVHPLGGSRKESTLEYSGNYIPNTVTVTDPLVPDETAPYGWKADYNIYNNWLQNTVFGNKSTAWGSFVWTVNLARSEANTYSQGTRLIVQPQIHGDLRDHHNIGGYGAYDEGGREPMDEEIQAQAMIAIAHGADGLSWFWFNSFVWDQKDPHYYSYGLLSTDNINHRISNCYGQNKWNDIASMNDKILNWKSTLDNITWQSGYSVHSETSNHAYIEDIQSTYQLEQPNGPVYSDDIKYWEMGFFTTADVNRKYFMMVNRRCVPDSDWRWLGIKFDKTALGTYRNWKLLDVATAQEITFDIYNQGSEGFLRPPEPMKTFQPGEGKLFKLEPVF